MAVMFQFKPDTAAANLIEAETFTLDDGVTALTFEFDGVAGAPDGVVGGNIVVDVSGDTTADAIRDTIVTAINGAASFNISAVSDGAATVDLTHLLGGTVGNTTSSDTVADAGFIVTNMAGGLDDGAFSGPLAQWAAYKRKIRWVIQNGVESSPHIAHRTWFGGPLGSYAQPPNSVSIVVKYGGPSWWETPLEFNLLPYPEIRAQIANEVERGILEVLDSSGSPVTAATIRGTGILGGVT
jgi:hypothetical protein